MPEFWRVENRYTNEGPYQGFLTWGLWDEDKKIEVPPNKDGLTAEAHRHSHIFGFESREQLEQWMSPYILPTLDKHLPGRFVVRRYEVPSYAQVGGHQVTASWHKLGVPETFELCDIYNHNIIAVKEN